MQGRLNNVRTLLTESNIDAEAFNLRYGSFKLIAQLIYLTEMVKCLTQSVTLTFQSVLCLHRGQSPMHVLGHYGKENAAAIFELFLECMPEYPLDKPDNEGNTGTVTGMMTTVMY